ncbi:MAG: hypothetical protein B6U72_02635 [Candidatus Altiarchaeales archaeon ex4484_2]|nr:MAG: hypothetical protein B6U72_02635 [Candidatus Altiarchaeales archaeon ex4484_2]
MTLNPQEDFNYLNRVSYENSLKKILDDKEIRYWELIDGFPLIKNIDLGTYRELWTPPNELLLFYSLIGIPTNLFLGERIIYLKTKLFKCISQNRRKIRDVFVDYGGKLYFRHKTDPKAVYVFKSNVKPDIHHERVTIENSYQLIYKNTPKTRNGNLNHTYMLLSNSINRVLTKTRYSYNITLTPQYYIISYSIKETKPLNDLFTPKTGGGITNDEELKITNNLIEAVRAVNETCEREIN